MNIYKIKGLGIELGLGLGQDQVQDQGPGQGLGVGFLSLCLKCFWEKLKGFTQNNDNFYYFVIEKKEKNFTQ